MREAEAEVSAVSTVVVGGAAFTSQAVSAITAFDDAADSGQRSEALIKCGGAGAAFGAQLVDWHRGSGSGKHRGDALIQRARRRCRRLAALDELQGKCLACFDELNLHRLECRGGAVLDRQGESIAVAAEIEVAVAPGVELRGSAQRLA